MCVNCGQKAHRALRTVGGCCGFIADVGAGCLCDLSLFFFLLLSLQADATHERVVKREDGERLAKVNL